MRGCVWRDEKEFREGCQKWHRIIPLPGFPKVPES